MHLVFEVLSKVLPSCLARTIATVSSSTPLFLNMSQLSQQPCHEDCCYVSRRDQVRLPPVC